MEMVPVTPVGILHFLWEHKILNRWKSMISLEFPLFSRYRKQIGGGGGDEQWKAIKMFVKIVVVFFVY